MSPAQLSAVAGCCGQHHRAGEQLETVTVAAQIVRLFMRPMIPAAGSDPTTGMPRVSTSFTSDSGDASRLGFPRPVRTAAREVYFLTHHPRQEFSA